MRRLIEALVRLVKRLLGFADDNSPRSLRPGTITAQLEIDEMARVVITINAPTERVDGAPVAAGDITEVRIATRADAASEYTQLGNPIPATQKTVHVDNVPGGKWWYRATWIDKNGGHSSAETSVQVPFAALKAGTIAAAIG